MDEHAGLKIAQSSLVEELYCAPETGISAIAQCVPIGDGYEGIVVFKRKQMDMVVVAPMILYTEWLTP